MKPMALLEAAVQEHSDVLNGFCFKALHSRTVNNMAVDSGLPPLMCFHRGMW